MPGVDRLGCSTALRNVYLGGSQLRYHLLRTMLLRLWHQIALLRLRPIAQIMTQNVDSFEGGRSTGRGILVITEREKDIYSTPGGRQITWSELRYHLSTILSGLYSL